MATETGFATRSKAEWITAVSDDINSRMSAAGWSTWDAYVPQTFPWLLSRVIGATAWSLERFGAWAAKQIFLDYADAQYLDRIGNDYGMSRNGATQSEGLAADSAGVYVTAQSGSTLPAGAGVRRTSDGLTYATLTAHTWSSTTSAWVDLSADSTGPDSNSDGAAGQLVSTYAGITSSVQIATTGGADEEGDTTYRARLVARLRVRPQGGAKADYEEWAKDTDGVSIDKCWVYGPYEVGVTAGNVLIMFTILGETGADIFPTPGDIALVQAYVEDEARKPVTATVTVEAPIAIEATVALSIKRLDGYTALEVTSAVKESIQIMIATRAVPWDLADGIVRNSWLRDAITDSLGVDYFDITALTLDGAALAVTANLAPSAVKEMVYFDNAGINITYI